MSSSFEDLLSVTNEIGYVKEVAYPILKVEGLPALKMSEVVQFESGELGICFGLSTSYCEILLFSSTIPQIESRVVRTGNHLELPVHDKYLGSIIDPFGKNIDTQSVLGESLESRIIDIHAPKIAYREKVRDPFYTGVTVVDLMVPLGKGQRQLVLGDRKTGKTEFLMQTLLTQATVGTICIYVGIAKKKKEAKKVENFLNSKKVSHNVIQMYSFSSDPLGVIYITPYAAMTLAEYYKDKGYDVLVILDDLTSHARFYREISLLARKFPGRGSYPGDIFYSHARLLERAGAFKTDKGAKTITCLPVAETVGNDISGYIQTNLMSITDGHIFFDTEIFEQGRRPAVNTFLSVTRVGRQTQSKLRWGVNRELSSFLGLHSKTERFSHFGSELNEGIKATLAMGTRVFNYFNQNMGFVLNIETQILIFCLIWVGILNDFDRERLQALVFKAARHYRENEAFKNTIDDLVNSSTDFNQLLGKVSAKSTNLIELLNNA